MKPIRLSIIAGAAGVALLVAGVEVHAAVAPSTPIAIVSVHPAAVSLAGDGPGGCTGSNGLTWVCTFHVSETSGSTESLTWQAGATATSGGGSEATFNPSGGTLHPGNSVTVKATVGCDGGIAFLITTRANGTFGNGAAVYYMQCG